ncbi:MAG: hypothetical protein AAF607_03885 [Pseudomonadota bacterium]
MTGDQQRQALELSQRILDAGYDLMDSRLKRPLMKLETLVSQFEKLVQSQHGAA